MAQNLNPGDVEFGNIMLEGKDFSDKMVSAVFKEHVMAPFVKGKIMLNQYEGAMSAFDGTRETEFSFRTPEGMKRKYGPMLTNGLGDVSADEGQRSRNFSVDLISKHAIINNSTPNYQKSFRNKQISGVVESILSEGLGVNLPINIDGTRGLQGSDYQPIILTQKSPLKHLDDLRRMAVSEENYDGFLLFSGIGGSGGEEIFFRNIYKMIKSEPVATITNMSNYEINADLQVPTMHNAMEVFFTSGSDQMQKVSSFGKGSTRYDINKAVGDVPQLEIGKGRQTFGSGTSLNPGKLSGFVNDPFNGMPGTSNLLLEDSRRPDSMRAETAAYTESLFADMMQSVVTVKVPGNSNYKLGDIVNFELRENTENFINKDTQYYGKNMIVGMTHYIGPLADRPRYVTYLDLVNIQSYNGVVG